LRSFDPGNSPSGTVKRGGKLPRFGSEISVVSMLLACPSRPLAICGLLFFEGLVDEGAQPKAEVEVPLGAEALET